MDNFESLYFNISLDSIREMIRNTIDEYPVISETDHIHDIDILSVDDLGIDVRVIITKD